MRESVVSPTIWFGAVFSFEGEIAALDVGVRNGSGFRPTDYRFRLTLRITLLDTKKLIQLRDFQGPEINRIELSQEFLAFFEAHPLQKLK